MNMWTAYQSIGGGFHAEDSATQRTPEASLASWRRSRPPSSLEVPWRFRRWFVDEERCVTLLESARLPTLAMLLGEWTTSALETSISAHTGTVSRL